MKTPRKTLIREHDQEQISWKKGDKEGHVQVTQNFAKTCTSFEDS